MLSALEDGSGAVVTAGYDCSNMSLQPVVGGGTRGQGNCFAFIESRAADGTVNWIRNMGGAVNGGNDGYVAADGSGGYAVAWATRDDAFATADSSDLVVSHFTSGGVNDWNWQSGLAGNERVSGIGVGADGSIVVGGTIDSDVYVTKLHRASGATVHDWTSTTGSTGIDLATGLVVRAGGTVVLVGQTRGAMTGSGAAAPAYSDGFVVLFSAAGARQWTRQIHLSSDLSQLSAANAIDGSIVVAGSSLADPTSASTYVYPKPALFDISATDGSTVWRRLLGSVGTQLPFGVAIDSSGNIYVAGHASGGTVVGGGTTSTERQPFVIKTDSTGKQLWARQTESTGSNGAYVWGLASTTTGVLIFGEAINDMGGANNGPGQNTDDAWYVTISAAGDWQARHS